MHYYKIIGHPDSYRQLWENREALDKYLARLKELMEQDAAGVPLDPVHFPDKLPVKEGGEGVDQPPVID